MTIGSLLKKYQGKIDFLDLELIIAHIIKKNREFVLSHPEYKLVKNEKLKVKSYLSRRMKHEPLAYILGEKEFFGLKFKVNKNTLIPRPETELIVERVIDNLQSLNKNKKITIVDIGTGSGNIIISIASQLKNFELFGIDTSRKALIVARHNAKFHKLENKIKFLHGNLLEPLAKKCSMFHVPCSMIIVANLPYLSPKIYASCSQDIKKYEPKTALISQKEGLAHYENLLRQIFKYRVSSIGYQVFLEISPEQKNKISKLIKQYFPKSKIIFHKDLAGRWRICELEILNFKF